MASPRNSAPCSSPLHSLKRDFTYPGLRRARHFVRRICLPRTVCRIAIARNLPAPKLPAVAFSEKPKARGGSDRKLARAVRSASVTSTAVCRRCSMTRAIPQRSGLSRISTTNSMGEVPNSQSLEILFNKHVSLQREIGKQPEVFSLRLDRCPKNGLATVSTLCA